MSSKPAPAEEEAITCDALCSLSASGQQPPLPKDDAVVVSSSKGVTSCAKHFQLPMFLSKTYHMIERCDPKIAGWSEAGDNFVVKNVDTFASTVLPLYFKHSNFSSFARQLNFYGFRKLRPDTILTTDLDPSTANHVRFYHQYFQRDKPELLQNIKRATTKGINSNEQQNQPSKDEVDTLRQDVANLRQELQAKTTECHQKIAELSYDCNRRISAMSTELETLRSMVPKQSQPAQQFFATTGTPGQIVVLPTIASQGSAAPVQMHLANTGNLFQSLSQAATVTLQQENSSGEKRPAEHELNDGNAKLAKS